ncbi:MAG: hypothetical protein ACKO0M_07000 [Cyanobium sp.]
MTARGAEARRTDREEGLRLLFGAAQDLARQRGRIAHGVQASLETSDLERGLFKLRGPRNQLIAAIPVQDVRDMLAYRRQLAREVVGRAGVQINDANPARVERGKLRIQTAEVRALAWAISDGRRIPYRPRQPWQPWILIGLLLCGVVPGLIFALWLAIRRRAYRRELAALVQRWRRAGMPEPAASFFELYGR